MNQKTVATQTYNEIGVYRGSECRVAAVKRLPTHSVIIVVCVCVFFYIFSSFGPIGF